MNSDSSWVNLEDAISAQLDLQVALSFHRHHGFLVQNGLPDCRTVVDLGTGEGRFLRPVAEKHPGIAFIGIDNKPHMIAAAKSHSCPNASWVVADALDSTTASHLGTADGIIMRYFLLHMPDTDAALERMLGVTRPGTRLWVFDLDTDHSRCEPPDPSYDAFRKLVQDFCDVNKVEIRTGSKLPPVLERLGFEVDAIGIEGFSNREIERARFAEYLYREALLYHYFLHGTPGADTMGDFREFLRTGMDPAKHFVQYGMVMIGAVKRRG